MIKHSFFSLDLSKLEILRQEYLSMRTPDFSKKYHIWRKATIELFWKKGMKWIVWPKVKVKKISTKHFEKCTFDYDRYKNDKDLNNRSINNIPEYLQWFNCFKKK